MKNFSILTFLFFIFLSGCTGSSPDYSVQLKDGVPFIHIDGKPVRSRMFYSNVPGTKYQYINKNEKEHCVEFSPSFDTKNATISLNFGAEIKDIWISKLTLENLTDKTKKSLYDFSANPVDKNLFHNWTVKALEAWRDYSLGFSDTAPDTTLYPTVPYSAKNENGVLHIDKACIDMSIPKNRWNIHDIERLNFCIKNIELEKGKKYRLVAKVRANTKGRFETMVYDTKSLELIGTNTQETFMTTEKYAEQVGVDFITFGVPAFWKDDETCKKLVDSRFEPVIEANPNAKIIVRLGIEPPDEWLDAHPNELMCDVDGKPVIRKHVRFPFPGSEVYRNDAMQAMKKFIKYVEEKYPNNIAGYHPSGGGTSEWYYTGDAFNGYSDVVKKCWRKWLKQKYQTDEALQKAWRNPNAKIDEATAPTEKERRNEHYPLINPETSYHVADFNVFLQDAMSGIVLLAAKTIRECAPNRLSVIFYGYGFGQGYVRRGPAYSGHYAMRKVLNSPYVDIITCPISYQNRQFGGLKCCSAPTESTMLSGKLWLDEDDNRTWLAPESGSPPYVLDFSQTDREKSKMVMRRNMMQQALRNYGSWWMDLFGCGWYYDRELWNVQSEFKQTELDYIENPNLYTPEVAVSYDEYSVCQVSAMPYVHSLTTQTLQQGVVHRELKTGSAIGYYLFGDIINEKANPKLHYVSASFALDKKQRELLRKSEERMTNIYMWRVGYIDKDERKFSLKTVEEATGFKVEELGEMEAEVFPTDVLKKEGITKKFGNFKLPLLSPVLQKGDVVLATYKNGKPAIVVRKTGKYPQIFCGITVLSTELCKYFGKLAGVHHYVDNNAVASANGNYVGFNTTKDGKHTLTLKEEAEVFDVLEKKNLGRFKTKTFDLKMGDVKLFKLSN